MSPAPVIDAPLLYLLLCGLLAGLGCVAGVTLLLIAIKGRAAGLWLAGAVLGIGLAVLLAAWWHVPRYWWISVPPLYLGVQGLRTWRQPPETTGLRVRLSTLLMFLAACGLLFAGLARLARQRSVERQALAELGPRAETVLRDFDGVATGVVLRSVNDSTFAAAVPQLERLGSLRLLQFRGPLSAEGLRPIRRLSHLRVLGMQGVPVDDEGLRHLAGLRSLEQLDLMGTQVTDDGLRYLQPLRRLRHLWLGGTQVTAAGVDRLQQLLPQAEIGF